MKNSLCVFTISLILLLNSGCKKINVNNALIIKDCTGTYLRIKDQDFKVCNAEKIESLSSNTAIKATYKLLNECVSKEIITCNMFHKNEGNIQIISIQ